MQGTESKIIRERIAISNNVKINNFFIAENS
jgi:hypothetical protein